MAKLNILVPTDFSKNATNALRHAVAIAEKFNSKLTLLHAFEAPIIPLGVPARLYEQELKSVEKAAKLKFKELESEIEKIASNIEIKTILAEGNIIYHIEQLEKKRQIDFIVMGSKGIKGIEAFIFGSVASDVLERVSCPVFIIPESARYHEIKNIVYASDLIENDKQKLSELSSFASAFNAEITVLNVSDDEKEIEEALVHKYEKEVRKVIDYQKLRFSSSEGSEVIESIEEFMKKNSPDLLVMSTRKRAFLENIFNPSLSKKMISHTHIPLLIFHF